MWILSSVPFYIYLFHCYQSYLLFYERVEHAMESEIASEDEILSDAGTEPEPEPEMPSHLTEIAGKIREWIAADGYLHPGLTIKELADTLHTNRTYLSGYIKATYDLSFRDWVTDLRMEYAKRSMLRHPEQNIAEIAEISGFVSPSHFTRIFKEKEGVSPSGWRRSRLENDPIS